MIMKEKSKELLHVSLSLILLPPTDSTILRWCSLRRLVDALEILFASLTVKSFCEVSIIPTRVLHLNESVCKLDLFMFFHGRRVYAMYTYYFATSFLTGPTDARIDKERIT